MDEISNQKKDRDKRLLDQDYSFCLGQCIVNQNARSMDHGVWISND
jgi:hypothetical protein